MTKVGFGYDSHRFAPNRPLVLGGERIEAPAGLAGHSDADVVLHAVIDALLGAAGLEDIGTQFPDTDPAYDGADSAGLTRRTMELVREAGFSVVNCDVTVLAEEPKLAAHKPAMRRNIAGLLGVEPAEVCIKAKTNEGMGAIGRGEGIATMAVVLLDAINQE